MTLLMAYSNDHRRYGLPFPPHSIKKQKGVRLSVCVGSTEIIM